MIDVEVLYSIFRALLIFTHKELHLSILRVEWDRGPQK